MRGEHADRSLTISDWTMSPARVEIRSLGGARKGWRDLVDRASTFFGMTSRAEFRTAMIMAGLLIVFKLLNTARYKFNTDESQHLHVIWGWARGFIQYRDMCDNHMPLFQIAFAPIYGLIGDRESVLYWMRFVLLPLYGVVAWCTYRIGALLFSRRIGIWAVIMSGFYPGYHFCSLEFRTDNAWAPLWLLCVLTIVEEGFTTRAAWTSGILLGLCFGISMKTTLLLLSLGTSATLSLWMVSPDRLGLNWKYLAGWAARFLVAAASVPSIIMLAFAYRGVWRQFRYWVFENNVLPGLKNHPAWWVIIFPIIFPVVVYVARVIVRETGEPLAAFRRSFVFLICGFYIPALWSFWSLVSRQDYIPHQPLAFVLYSGALILLWDYGSLSRPDLLRVFRGVPFPVWLATVEFLVALIAHPFLVDGEKPQTELLRQTLRLTDPGDYVLDEKGETVFRQRAFKPIWEPCVVERIRRGLMVDDAAERCVATRTCVVRKGKDMSSAAVRFIDANYISIGGQLRVAGTFLRPTRATGDSVDFDITIPAYYTVVSSAKTPVTGLLDGASFEGSRFLAAGPHTFKASAAPGTLAIVWAQAIERGYTPVP